MNAHARDREEFSELVGTAYDACFDPELWPSVLEKVGSFTRASLVNLFSQDVLNQRANRLFSWGGDAEFHESYLTKYVAINPLFPKSFIFPAGEVLVLTDIISYDEYRDSRFYKEWAGPHGFIDFAGVIIEKMAASMAALAVVRHERDGLVDDEMIARMKLIAPHVRRALLIGKAFDLSKVQTATFAETIDGLSLGVFLVDGRGRLVHTNASGEAMLGAEGPLKAADGLLAARDEQANGSLNAALAAIGSGDTAMKSNGIAMELSAAGGSRYLAHVLPLSGARREALADWPAAAAVLVRRANIDVGLAIDAAAQLYRLTPAEVRIVRALIDIGGVGPVAEAIGTSKSTVKKHLESIFKKTGTRRQTDLFKLIAGFDGPTRRP